MKKSAIFLTIALLILGIFTINAIMNTNNWHDTSNILVEVDDFTMTLQEATDINAFVEGATSSGITVIPNPGHDFDEIWVSTNTGEKTLMEALSTSGGLCKTSPTDSYVGPTDSLFLSKAYHYANEIEISFEKSLQDAIDNNEVCCWSKDCGVSGCVLGACYVNPPHICPPGMYCAPPHPSYYLPRQEKICYERGCDMGSCYENINTEIQLC